METFPQQLTIAPWVEWLGMISGIAGVWLSIKEKVGAWPLFIVCYSIYAYIGYLSGIHAFMGMNVVFIAISLYGWSRWSKQDGSVATCVVCTAKTHWPFVAAFIVLGTAGIGWLLGTRENAYLPYLDAFATCCGFTAQWMLGRKQIETWLFWIMSDLIYLGLFIKDGSWPSVILFTVFIVLAVKGWRQWRLLMKQHGFPLQSTAVSRGEGD